MENLANVNPKSFKLDNFVPCLDCFCITKKNRYRFLLPRRKMRRKLLQKYFFMQNFKEANLLPVFYSFFFRSFRFSDGLSHSAKRLSESHRLDLMRNITELLGRTFPSQFVFPVLGHEDVQNSDYKDYKNFLLSLGNIWRQWLPLEALQTFEKGKIFLEAACIFFCRCLLNNGWGWRWRKGLVVVFPGSSICIINFVAAQG